MENDNTFPDQLDTFRVQQAQLQRRRELAKQMIQQGLQGNTGSGYQGGRVYMVGSPLGNVAAGLAGQYLDSQADQQQQALDTQENAATRELIKRLGTPGTVEQTYNPEANPGTGPLVNGTVPMTPQEESARRMSVMGEGLAIPSLRKTLEAQIGQELDNPHKERLLDAKLTQAQAIADARNKAMLEGIDARIAGQIALKGTQGAPSVHVSVGGGKGGIKAPSGYRYNEDGTALEAIPGGPADKKPGSKPLTAKQLETQRGFMDLDSSIANYEKLLDAYDFQGKTAVDPAKRAALEGAYTDLQMKLKTLYELGAPQAGDLKLLSQALPSPVDMQGTVRGAAFGADPFKAKLGETKKLLNSSRANFETQMKKDTPDAAKPTQPTEAPKKRLKWNAAKGDFE